MFKVKKINKYNLGGFSNMNTALTDENKPKEEENKAISKINNLKSTNSGASPSGGQTSQPQNKKTSSPKKASSGMFTNVKKYIQRNQPGAQRMSQSVQKNVSQENQNIQQAINKQKTDFMSRVQSNRDRIKSAQEFGEKVVGDASNAINIHQAQDTIRDIQNRISNFQFGGQDDRLNLGTAYDYYLKNWEKPQDTQSPTYSSESMQYGLEKPLKFSDFVVHKAGDTFQNMYDSANEESKKQALTNLENYNQVRYSTTPQTESKRIEELANQRYALEQDLMAIEDKIANRPDDVTDEDIIKFNKIREGVQRYDNVLLNLDSEKGKVNQLMDLADNLKTAKGRREFIRDQFGRRGNYTQGQLSLDNLILSSNKQALNDIINNASTQAQQSQEMLQEAFRQGRISKQELRIETEKLHDNFQNLVNDARANLVYGDEEYRNNVNELNAIQSKIDSGEFTEEDMARAAQLKSTIDSYEGNIGLTGRARTGEGTFLKTVQDKLASGKGLTAEELKYLGYQEGDFMGLSSNVQKMLRDTQIDPETFSIQDVATLDDIARASDLARLGGDKASTYLEYQLGIDEDAYNNIVDRYTMGEGDTSLTTTEELSEADTKAIDKVAAATKSDQKKIRNEMQAINNIMKHAYSRLAEASKFPPHDNGTGENGWQHYHYHWHEYRDIMNKARQVRNKFFSKYYNAPLANVEGMSKSQLSKDMKDSLDRITPKVPKTVPYGTYGQPVVKESSWQKWGRRIGGVVGGAAGSLLSPIAGTAGGAYFGRKVGEDIGSMIDTGQPGVGAGTRVRGPEDPNLVKETDRLSREDLGGVTFSADGGVRYEDGGIDNRRIALKKLSNRNYLKYIKKG